MNQQVIKTFDQLQKGDTLYIVNLYNDSSKGETIEVPKALETVVEDVYTEGNHAFVSYRTQLEDVWDDGDNMSIMQEMLPIKFDQSSTSEGFFCTTKEAAQTYIASYISDITDGIIKELERIQKKMDAYTELAFHPVNYFLKLN